MSPLLLAGACTAPKPPPDDGPADGHSAATAHTAPPGPDSGTPPVPQHTGLPCGYTGLPAPPVPPEFADCPRFDWLVHLFAGSSDHADRVLALPDGDTVVAGTFSGSPQLSTDCVDAQHASGPLNVFVERLGPDGTQRWGHTLTGGYDGTLGDLALSPRGDIWVVGSYGLGPLEVDGVEVGGVDHRLWNPFAVQFAPDGTLQRTLLSAVGDGLNQGWGVAEDDAGNVYLLGTWSGHPLTVGPFTMDPYDPSIDDGFLAAFGPDDTPLWLTGITLRREDFSGSMPAVLPVSLAFVGTKLVANVRLAFSGENTLIRQAGGPSTYLDLGRSDDTLIPFDPATGAALANTTQIGLSYFVQVEGTGPTSGRLAGNTAGTWTDTQGVEHVVPGDPVRKNPFVAEIDELGGLVSMRYLAQDSSLAFHSLDAVDVRPDGTAWVAATQGPDDAPFGAGTAWEWLPPEGADGALVLVDPDNQFRCGAVLNGGRNKIHDVAVDALGGVVFVGEFAGELQLELPGGRAARRVGESDVIYDGFIARLAPP